MAKEKQIWSITPLSFNGKDRDILVMDRREIQATVKTVDMADELRELSLQLGRFRERWLGDLNQHHLSSPLRVTLQQLLERLELFNHSL